MKLIFCPFCEDVRKLAYTPRTCVCGQSWGYYYEDGLHAVIGGKAIPLGFNNASLADALRNRPEGGMGERFEAFVIPEHTERIKVE
jgi:hypothetical protein